MPIYAFGQSGQSDALPQDAGNGKFFYNSENQDPFAATPSSTNTSAIQKVLDAIKNKFNGLIEPLLQSGKEEGLSKLEQAKKDAADIINKKEKEALSQKIVGKRDMAGKGETERLQGIFNQIRGEVNAIIDEEFQKSCGRAESRINNASFTIDTIQKGIKDIQNEELAQGTKNAQCSIDKIDEIATAYITKRLAFFTVKDKNQFVDEKLNEVQASIQKIGNIIAGLQNDIDNAPLGLGNDIRKFAQPFLLAINQQLQAVQADLLSIHNKILRDVEIKIIDNSLEKKDMETALGDVQKKLGNILNNINGIEKNLNAKALQTGAQKQGIDLKKYQDQVDALQEQIPLFMKDIQDLSRSETIKDLYKVLSNKDVDKYVDIAKPFVLPPRIATPSPGGPMTADLTDAEVQRAKEAALKQLQQDVSTLEKQRDALRLRLKK